MSATFRCLCIYVYVFVPYTLFPNNAPLMLKILYKSMILDTDHIIFTRSECAGAGCSPRPGTFVFTARMRSPGTLCPSSGWRRTRPSGDNDDDNNDSAQGAIVDWQ